MIRLLAALSRGSLPLLLFAVLLDPLYADESPGPAAPLLKMLDAGRVPADRVGAIVEMIGKRGDAGDLGALLARAVKPDGLPAAGRLAALQALADAANARGVKPAGEADGLGQLIQSAGQDSKLQSAAIRLAGQWKVPSTAGALRAIALDDKVPPPVRQAAIEALGQLGGDAARDTFARLSATDQPLPIRYLGAAGLAQVDLPAAAQRAVEALSQAGERDNPGVLLDAFLKQQGGAEQLARALQAAKLPAAPASSALQYLYSIGRTDGPLLSALSAAAGVSAQVDPPTKEQLAALMSEVQEKGDPQRGELVFRRANLSCMKCHSLSGAGGTVGPDLSAVGASSPVDYVINSILQPELQVKEQFQLAVVQTGDGKVYQGIIVEENVDRLVLKDATGQIHHIARDEEDVIKKGGSLMPKGLVNLMTHADFVDLVRFVAELGKPGPFTIRSTATVQRWRVLKTVPQELAGAVPDVATFKSRVLDADPADWLPAYAKVAGLLPLDELTAAPGAGSKVLYLQALVDVAAAGPVGIKVDSPQGVQLWIDDQPHAAAESTVTELAAGQHRLTLRVDTTARSAHELKAEFFRPPGSTAEFSVVGGS